MFNEKKLRQEIECLTVDRNIYKEKAHQEKEKTNRIHEKNLNLETLLKESNQNLLNAERIIDEILEILTNKDEETLLKENTTFSVYENEDKSEGGYLLYLNICSLGGCDFNEIHFKTHKEALQVACIYQLLGKKPDMSCACSQCYSEYMQSCI